MPRKYRQSAGEFVFFFSIGAMTVIQPYGRIIQLECILMYLRIVARRLWGRAGLVGLDQFGRYVALPRGRVCCGACRWSTVFDIFFSSFDSKCCIIMITTFYIENLTRKVDLRVVSMFFLEVKSKKLSVFRWFVKIKQGNNFELFLIV